MNTALQLLLLLSLGGTVMGLVLMAIRRLLGKRLPGAVYYYAWILVLVRLTLPLPGRIPMDDTAPADPPARTFSAPAEMTAAETWSAADRVWMAEVEQTTAMTTEMTMYTAEETPEETAAEKTASAQQTEKKTTIPWKRYLAATKDVLSRPGFWLVFWVLGAAVSAGGGVAGYLRFTRALRKTLRPANESDLMVYGMVCGAHAPRLVRSRAVRTPMLMGLFRPILVLPNRVYAPLMLENILRHELTHHRRGDILYKWIAMVVFSVHWFNPFMRLFRREMDRVCELSCDEKILRNMTAEEKQDYGETLLSLAAIRPLPRSVVATTFATEKRTLKERLEQIMTYEHRGKKTLALALAVLLLFSGCGMVMGPEAESAGDAVSATLNAVPPVGGGSSVEPEIVRVEAPEGGETVTVSTVDELLAAIAPNNTVILEPGEYILSDAETYGNTLEGGWYTWENTYGEGYQLNISGVENLTIQGDGEATICTAPRGVEVLAFYGCSGIDISGTVVGHTEMPAVCKGGVLYFNSCDDAVITDCGLYGCGTWGITAVNSRNVRAMDTDIYDCSYGAVWIRSSQNFRLEGGSVYDCGEGSYSAVFRVENSYGTAILNTDIHNNRGFSLVDAEYADQVYLMGSNVENNTMTSLFDCSGYSPVVSGCFFGENEVMRYAEDMPAVTQEGEELSLADLESMTLAECTYLPELNPPTVAEQLEKTLLEDGTSEVWVSTVDELLAAIGPDTLVHLAPGDYNLSEATGYGALSGQYYYWSGVHDGSQLVITGVENFHLVGEGKEAASILTEPRYAEVLVFNACENITLADLTAGHTQAPNTCAGGVIKFQDTRMALINNCGLFGCGILGVTAMNCEDIQVLNTEIYECSTGAAWISTSSNIAFDNCDIHDCGAPIFQISSDCVNITLDGENLGTGYSVEYYDSVSEAAQVTELLDTYGDYRVAELPAELTEGSVYVETSQFGDSRYLRVTKDYCSADDLYGMTLSYTITAGTAFASAREEYENAQSGYTAFEPCTINGCEGVCNRLRVFWVDEQSGVFFRLECHRGFEENMTADGLRAIAESVTK